MKMGSFRKITVKTGKNWIDENNLLFSTQNERKHLSTRLVRQVKARAARRSRGQYTQKTDYADQSTGG